MQVDNLRNTDVTELEKTIVGLQKENPAICYNVFNMDEQLQKTADEKAVKTENKSVQQQLDEMAEMISTIQATLLEIFGDHVLIKGRWQNLTNLKQ